MKRTDDFPFHRIPAPLVAWYQANKRALPWRENPTPYRVWVSEIMLQQTRVEAARDYYLRFLSALPSVYDLAACPEDKLMKLWEGLGYYSRARNLKKTAEIVAKEYGGEFPAEESALKSLPGIGEYTAGAILSIAFGKKAPAVDGNVLRVMARLSENPTDISDPAFRAYLKEKLAQVYPDSAKGCSDFTQSLMELGATVCKSPTAECGACPLSEICLSYRDSRTGEFPVMPQKKEKRKEKVFVFLIVTPVGVAVRRRESGVLKGMNEFPSQIVSSDGYLESAESEAEKVGIAQKILNGWGVSAFTIEKQEKYVHIFTHIRWDITCFTVRAESCPFPVYTQEQLENEVSLPTAFRQCARSLEREMGGR